MYSVSNRWNNDGGLSVCVCMCVCTEDYTQTRSKADAFNLLNS